METMRPGKFTRAEMMVYVDRFSRGRPSRWAPRTRHWWQFWMPREWFEFDGWIEVSSASRG